MKNKDARTIICDYYYYNENYDDIFEIKNYYLTLLEGQGPVSVEWFLSPQEMFCYQPLRFFSKIFLPHINNVFDFIFLPDDTHGVAYTDDKQLVAG